MLVELTLTHRSFNNSIDGACDYPLDACSEDYMSPSGTAWGIPWAPLGDSLVVPLGGLLLTNRDVSSRPEGLQAAPVDPQWDRLGDPLGVPGGPPGGTPSGPCVIKTGCKLQA